MIVDNDLGRLRSGALRAEPASQSQAKPPAAIARGVKPEVVFVFGSNLAGRHGRGAALEAAKRWGAEYGVGEGRTGQAYAIPTKDESLRTRSKAEIAQSFIRFWKYALRHPDTQFLLTPFGTGLAGYSKSEMREVYYGNGGPLRNIWLTGDWE